MSGGEYGQYLTEGVLAEVVFPEHEKSGPLTFKDVSNTNGDALVIGAATINHSWCMDPFPLKHLEADQWLVFMGSNASDLNDFDAEIELCLGEEQEKHVIRKPTTVYVPRGMAHCPLTFKTINKPVIFINMISGNYTRLLYRDGSWKAYESIAEERAGTEWEVRNVEE